MTFPQSPRVVFDRNPLAEVICQLKFPTILEIGAERPARFQNEIREVYPLYEVGQPSLPKELAEIFTKLPIPQPADGVTYKFLSESGDQLISLSPEFVAFTDKKYVRWERFSKEVERAKEALEGIYKPAFYTRIGLRYRDVIDKEALGLGEEPWEQLLWRPLTGLLSARDGIGAHVREIRTEAFIKIDEVDDGFATVRHGLGRTASGNREVYVIDMDFYTTERTLSEHVLGILQTFNRLNGNFFRWVITDKLRDALGPRELQPEN